VFENKIPKGMSGPNREEERDEWRKSYNKELRNLNSSYINVWIIKSRSIA
jgi:hypothetical protein